MHPSFVDAGAHLRTTTLDGKALGYPPARLSAGTTYGDSFNAVGAKSCVLTASTGTATGAPTAQKCTASLESAPTGTSPSWVAVDGSAVFVDGDKKSARRNVDLTRLPSGHALLRVKVVAELTGGTTPTQDVAAAVVLAGFSTLPA
ncbi:hypothetical protein [Archangium primigenium]|uniref:hypothetical protein n=1 Tax=[Archangium] primigenium TaxID=2792470 RepID=UPI001959F9DE|nr:hypothetical protein [Archangium primigenium]MBM7117633.1 hypothetical protein [Archangium primigenium]